MRRLGKAEAERIWKEAGEEYSRILTQQPDSRKHKGAMVLPSVALSRVLSESGQDAESLLNQYGDKMGELFARIVHGITSIPGVDWLIWRHIEGIMDKMSGEALGGENGRGIDFDFTGRVCRAVKQCVDEGICTQEELDEMLAIVESAK